MANTVLVYSRPGLHDWWWQVAEIAFPDHHLVGLSEFRNVSDIWFMESFYRFWNKGVHELQDPSVPFRDVRARCRLLRNLSEEQSRRMVACAWCALQGILNQTAPQAVFSLTVDCYILDLLARACTSRGIPFVGLVGSFVPGYTRISERGEHNYVREPVDEEVGRVLKLLLGESFKPNFMGHEPYYPRAQMKRAAVYHCKQLVYWMKRPSDPLNYSFLALPYLADRRDFFGFRVLKYFDDDAMDRWQTSTRPRAYIPLHLVPEATVDYWTENLDFVDYERTLFGTLEILSRGFLVGVKEHPSAIGTRTADFYQKIKSFDNVVLIHAHESSVDLILGSDLILTWTGTVGFEAALRAKTVALMGNPYYYHKNPLFIPVKNLDDLRALSVQTFGDESCSEDLQRELVRHILANNIEGALLQRGFKNTENARILGEQVGSVFSTRQQMIVSG